MYCTKTSAVKHLPHESIAVSLPCRSWTCEHCQPQRRRQLIAQANAGHPNTFITLTVRPSIFSTPEEAASALARAWRSLRYRAFREARRDIDRHPKPNADPPADGWPTDDRGRTPRQVTLWDSRLPFLAVIEAHESGWPHLHVIARTAWMSQRWISSVMATLIDSPIVDIRRVRHRSQVGAYVAKYLGKQPHRFGTTKRYWQSPDYQIDTREKQQRLDEYGCWWEITFTPLHQIAACWLDMRGCVEWQGHQRIVSSRRTDARAPP